MDVPLTEYLQFQLEHMPDHVVSVKHSIIKSLIGVSTVYPVKGANWSKYLKTLSNYMRDDITDSSILKEIEDETDIWRSFNVEFDPSIKNALLKTLGSIEMERDKQLMRTLNVISAILTKDRNLKDIFRLCCLMIILISLTKTVPRVSNQYIQSLRFISINLYDFLE